MLKKILPLILLSLSSNSILAAVYVEDFESAFPAWENGWLGTNSNLQNYYGVGQGRGNNPDGLWLDDGDGLQSGDNVVEIVFDSAFGATLSELVFDLAAHLSGLSVDIFDMSGTSIFNSSVSLTSGATLDPGNYESFSVTSSNGIMGFSLYSTGGQIEGNTGIDNVMVTTVSNVPVPAAIWLFASAITGIIGFKRR